MKFLKRLIYPKRNQEEIQFEWNKILEEVASSLTNDKLKYPIILLCHVPWDFQVFHSQTELIGESIGSHWGLNDYFSSETNESQIVIDSSGNTFKLSHEHYHKETKTGFSYPSKIDGIETLKNLKEKISDGSKSFISDLYPERENEIKEKLNELNNLNSIKEVIIYVSKYLQF